MDRIERSVVVLRLHPDGERMKIRFVHWRYHRFTPDRYLHVPIPSEIRDGLFELDSAGKLPAYVRVTYDNDADEAAELCPTDWYFPSSGGTMPVPTKTDIAVQMNNARNVKCLYPTAYYTRKRRP